MFLGRPSPPLDQRDDVADQAGDLLLRRVLDQLAEQHLVRQLEQHGIEQIGESDAIASVGREQDAADDRGQILPHRPRELPLGDQRPHHRDLARADLHQIVTLVAAA